MTYILGSHPVQDFNTWKPLFDSDEPRREANGIHLVKLFREMEQPNNIHFLFSAPSKEIFLNVIGGDNTKELMQKAGVLAPPTMTFLNEY